LIGHVTGYGEPTTTLVVPPVDEGLTDEGLTDDSQTFILLYGKGPLLKTLSFWHAKYRTYTSWHPKPILDFLQAMHESTINVVPFNLDKDGESYDVLL
jgi:hypothetical protein